MKLMIAVIATFFCVAYANPVPEESIDLVKMPLSGDKELDVITFAESDGKISERNKRTIGILRELFPQLSQVQAVEEDNLLEPSSAGSDAILETIRVAREINKLNNDNNNQINTEQDQETQASEKASDQQAAPAENSSIDELTLDSIEDDENRGKRFLNFGGASGNSGGGSGLGSGNFLFDIIRLVSGSSGTEQTDERNNGADDTDTEVGKGDGYTEGIPGPVTRLFVLANRGLSNLIQDLILRIAQTSERVVNFKARLITSLI